ncbi:hypothetical protein BPUTEOMOX_2357 [methanotrophic endosymbiont of Bathymodiolus puteoserpentis (Logatchev)]|nr:hypothetical protein BPUTEOMOX_2357 [methanotrophic endosymbiont of Bathymodiolus puteoserpentis (Logatchev)]
MIAIDLMVLGIVVPFVFFRLILYWRKFSIMGDSVPRI